MASRTLNTLFGETRKTTGRRPLVIGMVHALALPGTPKNSATIGAICETACHEASIYKAMGLDGIIVENMHDVPYLNLAEPLGPEIVASMTRICTEVKRVHSFKVMGVQILSARNKEALAVAQAADFNFIRAESFVFGHIGDEGFADSCAGSLLRYRKLIGAENVAVMTDLKKKHSSHAITSDVTLAETVDAAQFFLSDGVVLTGTATGKPTSRKELDTIVSHLDSKLPVLVGSGLTEENMVDYWPADGWIIGSYFKENGDWFSEIDEKKVAAFMNTFEQLCRARLTD